MLELPCEYFDNSYCWKTRSIVSDNFNYCKQAESCQSTVTGIYAGQSAYGPAKYGPRQFHHEKVCIHYNGLVDNGDCACIAPVKCTAFGHMMPMPRRNCGRERCKLYKTA